MKLTTKKRYLKIPVRFGAPKVQFALYENDVLQYGFEASYDADAPDAVYDVDLRDYLKREVELRVSVPFMPAFSHNPEPPAKHELRPAVHFSAPRGWINDPNGLCFYNGTYHLFYQHNPFDRLWGNMHWGHATSPDLIHWDHMEEAMFPDENGTMFSGSAVVDYENVSGFKDGDDAPILFFYTCAGEKQSTQCLAVSTDGGKTLKKYEKNPLIAPLADGNRDPKVIFDKIRGRWLMALYLIDRTYAIFVSQNLLDWTELQRFDLPGDDECPDFYPLTADDGRTLWVFSGAHDCYFVGDFDDNGLFCPIQTAGQLSYQSAAYAAQTYYYEAGRPVLRFAWNRGDIPCAPFNGSMCTVTEMGLRRIGERYYLTATPAEETKALKKDTRDAVNVSAFTDEINARACRVDIDFSAPLTLSLFGLEVQAADDGVRCKDVFLPRVGEGEMHLTAIFDTVSTELYLNGCAITAVSHIADYEKNTLSVHADAPMRAVRVSELSL